MVVHPSCCYKVRPKARLGEEALERWAWPKREGKWHSRDVSARRVEGLARCCQARPNVRAKLPA